MPNQSLPPSLDQQLADARTAVAVHIQRIAELEAVVDRQRGELEEATQRVASLQTLALSLCRSVFRPLGHDKGVVLVDTAALRAPEKAVGDE